jgi:hypothetical protein
VFILSSLLPSCCSTASGIHCQQKRQSTTCIQVPTSDFQASGGGTQWCVGHIACAFVRIHAHSPAAAFLAQYALYPDVPVYYHKLTQEQRRSGVCIFLAGRVCSSSGGERKLERGARQDVASCEHVCHYTPHRQQDLARTQALHNDARETQTQGAL